MKIPESFNSTVLNYQIPVPGAKAPLNQRMSFPTEGGKSLAGRVSQGNDNLLPLFRKATET